MIMKQQNQPKIQLDPYKNIIMFRIHKDKKQKYKWALYQRNDKGKQFFKQAAWLNLQQPIEEYILQEKQNTQTITKSRLFQSKALSNSSKINESSHLRSTSQKSNNLRKSSVYMNDIVIKPQTFLRPYIVNFIQNKIKLTYIFCIAKSQKQIYESIKDYALESKFNIIGRSFGRANSVEEIRLINSSVKKIQDKMIVTNHNKLQLIQEELENSHKTIRQGAGGGQQPIGGEGYSGTNRNKKKSSGNQIKQVSDNKISKLQINEAFQFTGNQPSIQNHQQQQQNQLLQISNNNNNYTKQQLQQRFSLQKQKQQVFQQAQGNSIIKVSINQTQREQTPKTIQRQEGLDNYQNQVLYNRTQYQQPRQNQPLYRTQNNNQKHTLPLGRQAYPSHEAQLIQTSPVNNNNNNKNILNTNNNLRVQQTSYLKLDDVILNGKRVSVSDKSQWMRTSRSRTDEYNSTQKSLKSKSIQKYKQEEESQQCQNQLVNNNQTNEDNKATRKDSKNDQQLCSLQIISLKPKFNQFNNSNQQIFDELGFTKKYQDQISKSQRNNQRTQTTTYNGNKILYPHINHLKRKSTAEEFIRKSQDQQKQQQQQIKIKHKTMQQSTIKKSLQIIQQEQQKLNQRDNHFQYTFLQEEPNDNITKQFMFNNNISKYRNPIPSMIDEQIQIPKSTDLQISNSKIQLTKEIDDSYQWGHDLSEIKQNNSKNQSKSGSIKQWFSNKMYSLKQNTSPLFQKYINPIVSRDYHKTLIQKVRENSKYKKIVITIIVLCFLIIALISFDVFETQTKRLSPNDSIFKQNNIKDKRKMFKKIKSKKK